MSIGNKIYELRTGKGLSQGELAEMLDVSRQSVSKWETDAAIPELDKLINICDVFGVTLDELTGRVEPSEAPPTASVAERSREFSSAKIVGYILLAISLIGGILLLFFADDAEELYVLLPILIAMLVCSVICLCVKEHIGYWCAWVALSPMTVLTPHTVGLPILTSVGCIQLIIYVIMTFAAHREFKETEIAVKASKTAAVIAGWIACVAVWRCLILGVFLGLPAGSALNISMIMTVNLVMYSAVALLLTYTVCYIKSGKRIKKK